MSGILAAVYFAGLILALGMRAPHERRRRRNRIKDHRGGWLEAVLMGLVVVAMFLLPTMYALSPWLDFADYQLPSWAGFAGILVFSGALWLFWRSHADLGRNFSPTLQVREEHTLVVRGVYRRVRHPMYAAQWLWGIAQILLLHNWIAGFSGLALSVLLYLLRIPGEERMMIKHFGEKYRSYMDRTGRIVPRPGRTEQR
ncbi:MAG: isoprenylcysteine carboxylmethyltransferase family protein [Rubrobacteraceae bacterium]|nr:isoprenylcysteine carboxylmethyltransferase family protein [Rubrobacteraceae bacterium]